MRQEKWLACQVPSASLFFTRSITSATISKATPGWVAGNTAPTATMAEMAKHFHGAGAMVVHAFSTLPFWLAVAGAAREHPGIMIVGLIFAVALMGLAANIIAKYIERYRWIAYIGLLIILYVALKMMWEGWHEVQPVVMGML